jgi:uncharacterized protein (DUF2062 family)
VWRRLRKRWRQGYVRLLSSPGAPKEIAGGVALGMFLAMLPVLQMPLAVGFAEGIRRVLGRPLSRMGAVAGTWLTNPITAAPLYGAALLSGRPLARLLLPEHLVSEAGTPLALTFSSAAPFALELFVALLIGGALLGLPLALLGYRLVHALVVAYQARRARRRRVTPPLAPAPAF